jgi:hypothetical protein
MQKLMISQPMQNKTKEEILKEREKAIQFFKSKGYKVINTVFEIENTNKNVPLHYLSKAILKMSECDAVYFMEGWQNARGCKIEHTIAKEYNLTIIY